MKTDNYLSTDQRRYSGVAVDQWQAGQTDNDVAQCWCEESREHRVPAVSQGKDALQAFHQLSHDLTGFPLRHVCNPHTGIRTGKCNNKLFEYLKSHLISRLACGESTSSPSACAFDFFSGCRSWSPGLKATEKGKVLRNIKLYRTGHHGSFLCRMVLERLLTCYNN